MRIDTHRALPSASRPIPRSLGDDAFSSVMLETETKEDKPDEKKGKLVAVSEEGYMRQYLVRPDGTKVLLSEMKEREEGAETTGNYSRPQAAPLPIQEDGLGRNARELIDLLNLQAGATAPSQAFKPFSGGE
ncbi:hypothetical protein [Cohnella boryungensis]|uniref:Uncharacterized protein n=1 Tax=Cohnella boryungensis TaxID=768479 RepID=A0ABV8SIQ9_9BACL